MSSRPIAAACALGALLLAACEKHEFAPPDRAQQVAQADSAFSPALFDSIAWPSDDARLLSGNEVYVSHCRKCHGPLGDGDTDYARAEGLEVPSLVAPGWKYADDLQGARRRIYTGHPAGMPTWGVAGIAPREIDAVAFYILTQLRDDAGARPQP